MSSDQLLGFEKGYTEIGMAHAKNGGHLFKAKWCYILLNAESLCWMPFTYPLKKTLFLKQPSHLYLGNMSK